MKNANLQSGYEGVVEVHLQSAREVGRRQIRHVPAGPHALHGSGISETVPAGESANHTPSSLPANPEILRPA